MTNRFAHIFAGRVSSNEIGDVVTRVRTKIEPGTVKRIDKTGGVTDARPTVITNLFAVIGQHRQRVHVALDGPRLAKNFATDRMSENMRMQSLRQTRAL